MFGVNSCIENNATHLFAMSVSHSLSLGVNEPLHLGMMKLPLETFVESVHRFQRQGVLHHNLHSLLLVRNDPRVNSVNFTPWFGVAAATVTSQYSYQDVPNRILSQ